jgi:hypothetical protein
MRVHGRKRTLALAMSAVHVFAFAGVAYAY